MTVGNPHFLKGPSPTANSFGRSISYRHASPAPACPLLKTPRGSYVRARAVA
jgi:hypothetical protein